LPVGLLRTPRICLYASLCVTSVSFGFLRTNGHRDRDDLIAAAEKIRPLNTYHSGSANAVEGLQLHPDLPSPATSLIATGAHTQSPGYQHFLQQQQQQQMPVDSWAGLMPESALNNLEELLRNGDRGGSSHEAAGQRHIKRPGNWDDEWEGPMIEEEEEAPRGGRMMQRLHGWLKRRQKKKQRRQQQLVAEQEQLQVEEQMLQQAHQQEQQHQKKQQPPREPDDGWRWG
jgi:hypothetical protein